MKSGYLEKLIQVKAEKTVRLLFLAEEMAYVHDDLCSCPCSLLSEDFYCLIKKITALWRGDKQTGPYVFSHVFSHDRDLFHVFLYTFNHAEIQIRHRASSSGVRANSARRTYQIEHEV